MKSQCTNETQEALGAWAMRQGPEDPGCGPGSAALQPRKPAESPSCSALDSSSVPV